MADLLSTLPRGTAARIAKATGLTPTTISRALRGLQCDEITAITIHFGSKGLVPCWSLRPDIWREGQIPPVPAGSDPAA